MVASFKKTLNKVLVDLDPYPIPTIDSTFNKIGEGKKYFSTLDLRNSYWQIVIDERCKRYPLSPPHTLTFF